MNIYDSGKPTTLLLAEYVDGGPGCIRDDCNLVETSGKSFLSSDQLMLEEKTKRCTSCGKTWTEKYQNGARIS